MSDTPMVDAMMKFCFGTDEEFVRIKDAAKLERELNASNESFRKLNIHTLNLVDRIRRLEEAGQKVEDAAYSVQDWSGTALGDALDELNKAKEDKP